MDGLPYGSPSQHLVDPKLLTCQVAVLLSPQPASRGAIAPLTASVSLKWRSEVAAGMKSVDCCLLLNRLGRRQ